MKILKFLFFIIVIFFILTIIAAYNLNKNYNLVKFIDNVEKEYNVKITLAEKPKWDFSPKIQLNLKSNIEDIYKNFSSQEIYFSFEQPYKLSPLKFEISSDSFLVKDLKIKFLNSFGTYNFLKKKITLESIKGEIGNGNFISEGTVDLSNSQKIILKGNLSNLHLNPILRQLNLANWQRIEIKLSSNNFLLFSSSKNLLQNLEGSIPLSGSIYFVVTEEERFGIAFLRLLIEKMPNFNNLSKSLSQIVEGFSGTPALFEGQLTIKKGIINTKNLHINNNNNQIKINGSYDMISDLFDAKIYFYDSNNLIVEAIVLGNIDNPSIQIINDNILPKNKKNNDIKKIFEEGIQSLIDKLLRTNE